MKKLIATLAMITISAWAQAQGPCLPAFEIEAETNIITRAKFKSNGIQDQHISFDESFVLAKYNHQLSCYEGIVLGAGFESTGMRWKQNTAFSDSRFNEGLLSVGGYSARLCNWLVRGEVLMNIGENTLFQTTVDGRYAFAENFGLHMGVVSFLGIESDDLFPVVGFDYRCNAWTINMIYPLDVSVAYQVCSEFKVFAGWTPFYSRHRLDENDGIALYRNQSAEIGVEHNCGNFLKASVSAGYAFGGSLRVSDKEDNHRSYKKFKASPYVGADIAVRF